MPRPLGFGEPAREFVSEQELFESYHVTTREALERVLEEKRRASDGMFLYWERYLGGNDTWQYMLVYESPDLYPNF